MADERPSRKTVVVLGMHRSGTSLTTGILNALGVSLSEDLMPPTNANAIGYFESEGIRQIQDRLLEAFGISWHGSTTINPFPANWWRSAKVQPFKDELKARVSDELSRVPGVWGFKDPRTARLLPLWNDIFTELALDPAFVIVGRHPREVARSLEARDNLKPLYSELLWLEHTSDAILYTRERPRAIVNYEGWFQNPLDEARYMIAALGFTAPADNVLQEVIAKYVSSDLRHHSAAEEPELPYSKELYQAMRDRNVQSLDMLAELFRVTAVFTGRIVRFALDSFVRKT